MSTYVISGDTQTACKVRLFNEADNEYLGYKDVSAGSYEIKFRMGSLQDIFAAGEIASGEAKAYGDVTPVTSSGTPTIIPPEQWEEKSGTFTAANGDRILMDSSGGIFTVNLPLNPIMGDTVSFVDGAGNCGTNNVTIGRNGEKIMGLNEDLVVDENNAAFDLVFYNSTYGWRLKYE